MSFIPSNNPYRGFALRPPGGTSVPVLHDYSTFTLGRYPWLCAVAYFPFWKYVSNVYAESLAIHALMVFNETQQMLMYIN